MPLDYPGQRSAIYQVWLVRLSRVCGGGLIANEISEFRVGL